MTVDELNDKYGVCAAIGDGWASIVDKALEACFVLDPKLKIAQIKEKFGGLRMYLDTTQNHEAIDAVITLAEWLAERTCEICGDNGTRDNENYVVFVRCKEHSLKYDD